MREQVNDPEMANGLGWMLDNDITDVIESTFSVLKEVDAPLTAPPSAANSPLKPPPPSNRPVDAATVTTSSTVAATPARSGVANAGSGGDADDANSGAGGAGSDDDDDAIRSSPSRKGSAIVKPVFDEVDLIPDGANVAVSSKRLWWPPLRCDVLHDL